MQELNQQEIAMVGGANLVGGLLTGVVLAAQNTISAVGGAAYNFGQNLTDTAGLLLTGATNVIAGVATDTIGVIAGVLTGN
ncbi:MULTISPECIES: hypothetical protein [Burkholderia]|uniref:hypothetical protein n=1 Tax=Burkholderia TaxID=32008 RepID=UPI00084196E1|nr:MULTISPECIES: hypothetical protein [unclassified Burkholderia]AOK28573.1 hypothetical protein AQ611_03150 [Burkholderia sp. Bp7605]